MNANIPKVSLGLPVYNGENFLAQTIEGYLTQTFEDFGSSSPTMPQPTGQNQSAARSRHETSESGIPGTWRTLAL